jgi:predicted nucleotidyltransferase
MNLQIETRHLNILKLILNKYPYQFYAYGSRTKGTAWKFSDLDLCHQENIPRKVIYQIQEELEESDLPFFVELTNWKQMRPEFRELIRKDLTLI